MKAWEDEPSPLEDINNAINDLDKVKFNNQYFTNICYRCEKSIDTGQEKIFHPVFNLWYCKDCYFGIFNEDDYKNKE